MGQWISRPTSLAAHRGKFPPNWREAVRQMEKDAPWCRASARFRLVASSTQSQYDTTEWNLSPAADAMIEDIYDAVQTSATPTQLAAALSPILDASFALDTLEEEMVQAALSVSQSSAEYWYDNNYSQMAVVASEASSELAEGCANGTMQGQTYESSGLSWQCQNLQWLQIAFKLKQSDGYFRFASLPLGTSFSCPSVGALYAGIAFADAAGAVYGAVRGWRLGLIGVAISGAWRAAQFSGGGAWTALGVDLFCNVF